jgi:hypothetical protein
MQVNSHKESKLLFAQTDGLRLDYRIWPLVPDAVLLSPRRLDEAVGQEEQAR